MNPCPIIIVTLYSGYCCCLIALFTWSILDEECNAGEHVENYTNNVKYKCKKLYKKIKKKGGYERVELDIVPEPVLNILPSTGEEKNDIFRHNGLYKPMNTLYEISEV